MNTWEATAIYAAIYVKAKYPFWSGEGDPNMVCIISRWQQKPTPERTNCVIVRKAA